MWTIASIIVLGLFGIAMGMAFAQSVRCVPPTEGIMDGEQAQQLGPHGPIPPVLRAPQQVPLPTRPGGRSSARATTGWRGLATATWPAAGWGGSGCAAWSALSSHLQRGSVMDDQKIIATAQEFLDERKLELLNGSLPYRPCPVVFVTPSGRDSPRRWPPVPLIRIRRARSPFCRPERRFGPATLERAEAHGTAPPWAPIAAGRHRRVPCPRLADAACSPAAPRRRAGCPTGDSQSARARRPGPRARRPGRRRP